MWDKYINSLFFVTSSMTGLGFASIFARSNLDYLMQSFIMIIGVSYYANVFSLFAVSIYNRNKKRNDVMRKLE